VAGFCRGVRRPRPGRQPGHPAPFRRPGTGRRHG